MSCAWQSYFDPALYSSIILLHFTFIKYPLQSNWSAYNLFDYMNIVCSTLTLLTLFYSESCLPIILLVISPKNIYLLVWLQSPLCLCYHFTHKHFIDLKEFTCNPLWIRVKYLVYLAETLFDLKGIQNIINVIESVWYILNEMLR